LPLIEFKNQSRVSERCCEMGDKTSPPGHGESAQDGLWQSNEEQNVDLQEVSGVIKWFDVAKGYGFILPDERGLGDILLHVTCLRRDGFQTALEGARVMCLIKRGERGLQ